MDDRAMADRLFQLKQEHRDLDDAIDALIRNGTKDQLQVMRLKRRKLMLRDEIAVLEAQRIPDIIA